MIGSDWKETDVGRFRGRPSQEDESGPGLLLPGCVSIYFPSCSSLYSALIPSCISSLYFPQQRPWPLVWCEPEILSSQQQPDAAHDSSQSLTVCFIINGCSVLQRSLTFLTCVCVCVCARVRALVSHCLDLFRLCSGFSNHHLRSVCYAS